MIRMTTILKEMLASGGDPFYIDNTLIKGVVVDLENGIHITPENAIQAASGLNVTANYNFTVPDTYITVTANAALPIDSVSFIATGDTEFENGIMNESTIRVKKLTAGESLIVASVTFGGVVEEYRISLFWRIPVVGEVIIDKPFILNSEGKTISITPFSGLGSFKETAYSFAQADDLEFNSPVLSAISSENETIEIYNDETVSNGDYILRVRQFDIDNNASAWSSTQNFFLSFIKSIVSDSDPFSDGSLVAKYELDGNANDTTGNYNGTATDVTYDTGKFGQGGVLSDTNGYIDTGFNPISGTNDWAISMMLNLNILNDERVLASQYQVGADGRVLFYTSSDGSIIINGAVTEAGLLKTDVGFQHLVLVRESQIFYLYIDKVLKLTNADTISILDTVLRIGGNPVWANQNRDIDGILDQVEIYNRALTAEEVDALYLQEL